MAKQAIPREPAKNFRNAVSTNQFNPNLYGIDDKIALEQHREYCDALQNCGVGIINISQSNDSRFPDDCFVQDTAFVFRDYSFIGNFTEESRRGEQSDIEEILERYVKRVRLENRIEFGDVIKTNSGIIVGLTKRTLLEAANEFKRKFLEKYPGIRFRFIEVDLEPHLTTGASYIGKNNLLVVPELIGRKELQDYQLISVEDERYAANCLYINGHLIMPKGYEKTKTKLLKKSYRIQEIEMSEFAKKDGGLTCLSVLW